MLSGIGSALTRRSERKFAEEEALRREQWERKHHRAMAEEELTQDPIAKFINKDPGAVAKLLEGIKLSKMSDAEIEDLGNRIGRIPGERARS